MHFAMSQQRGSLGATSCLQSRGQQDARQRTALVLGDTSEGGGAASEAWAGAPDGHDQLVHGHTVQPIQQRCVPVKT